MTAGVRVQLFQKWGVFSHETVGWANHSRPGHWGPVHGIMIHHTGDDAPDKRDYELLRRGRSDLAGPLCHWGMGDDGYVWQVGNGRASHAGLGSGAVLAAVISEKYGKYLTPGPDNTDGNPSFYGQETMYSGNKPMREEAYESTIRVCAAICEYHGWTGKSVIGHKEWTSRKPDPGKTDMADLRADVNQALAMGNLKARAYPFRNTLGG